MSGARPRKQALKLGIKAFLAPTFGWGWLTDLLDRRARLSLPIVRDRKNLRTNMAGLHVRQKPAAHTLSHKSQICQLNKASGSRANRYLRQIVMKLTIALGVDTDERSHAATPRLLRSRRARSWNAEYQKPRAFARTASAGRWITAFGNAFCSSEAYTGVEPPDSTT